MEEFYRDNLDRIFFNDSKAHYLRTEQENFLLGGDLLIIPKWTEDGAIPKGNWRDVSINGENSKTHKYHPDIKIRPGSIVPLCNNIQSTTSFSLDTITLLISLSISWLISSFWSEIPPVSTIENLCSFTEKLP